MKKMYGLLLVLGLGSAAWLNAGTKTVHIGNATDQPVEFEISSWKTTNSQYPGYSEQVTQRATIVPKGAKASRKGNGQGDWGEVTNWDYKFDPKKEPEIKTVKAKMGGNYIGEQITIDSTPPKYIAAEKKNGQYVLTQSGKA